MELLTDSQCEPYRQESVHLHSPSDYSQLIAVGGIQWVIIHPYNPRHLAAQFPVASSSTGKAPGRCYRPAVSHPPLMSRRRTTRVEAAYSSLSAAPPACDLLSSLAPGGSDPLIMHPSRSSFDPPTPLFTAHSLVPC